MEPMDEPEGPRYAAQPYPHLGTTGAMEDWGATGWAGEGATGQPWGATGPADYTWRPINYR